MSSDQTLPAVRVLDSTMAYREAGEPGLPVALFLHGNPTSSFIWRHILPIVAGSARCIAPDLIGFGQSGKPEIGYRFFDHVAYLDAFLETMAIEAAYIVAQDWGTALAFELAARRPDIVKGLAFMEFIRPIPTWNDFHQSEVARETFRKFRTPGIGEDMILGLNAFVERVLPGSVQRGLNAQEMEIYRAPFATPKSRTPTWRLPNELPIAGEPADVWQALDEAHAALRVSNYPKVLFAGNPGALVSPAYAEAFAAGLRNCRLIKLNSGLHYLQEDEPEAIAAGVVDLIAGAEHPSGHGSAEVEPHQPITITYCGPCGYESRATQAARSLTDELGLPVELKAGKGGVFQVAVAGQVVTSRRKGYFPDNADVVRAVREALQRRRENDQGGMPV
ncbi:MAG: haloalkane dehalogenase [Mesorhizobium sp.]|nr:haloalkane dehalogenase [Mesorhizobium sp. M4B.F.Ca.ET.088.02.2.1]RWF34070.1 MAG: haloalkane dehalogenase [Mesorhizobium sp.]